MDREDAHGIVVRLRNDRLDDTRPLLRLELGPLDELAQGRAPRLDEGARLVEDETQPLPVLARPSVGEGEFEEAPLPDNGLDDLVERPPPALTVQVAQSSHGHGYRIVLGQRVRGIPPVVPAAAGLDKAEEVVVRAGEGGRAQRRHQRNLIGWVVDRPQYRQEVAYLLRVIEEGPTFDAIRDAGLVQRSLQ